MLTKEERLELHKARAETQLINKRCDDICFEYIVVRNPPPRICFMSGRQREILPRINNTIVPPPNQYYIPRSFIKTYPHNNGYSPLATKTPRFIVPKNPEHTPSFYNINPAKVHKQCYKPFGIGENPNYEQKFTTPYPGIYESKKYGYKINQGFGKMRKIVPNVKIICTMVNISECSICGKQPYGDYRHNFTTNSSMCYPCWHDELKKTLACNKNVIKAFQRKRSLLEYERARHCSFSHIHNGTTAAVQILSHKILRFKVQKENYLGSYGI